VSAFTHDLRHALRGLRRTPSFTAIAVLTLALGIGGSTAVFSLAAAVLLGGVPFRQPDRLLMVWDDASQVGFPRNDLTPAEFATLRGASRSFEDLAAVTEAGFVLTGGGEPEKLEGRRVTSSFFALLGVAPQIGRVFGKDEDRPGAGRVAVLSHGFWQRRFGGDPSVLGRDLVLNGEGYRVVGVMPRGFQFLESYVAVFVPAAFPADELANRGAHYLTVFGRLHAGVTAARAGAEVASLAQRMVHEFPDQEFHAYVLPMREQLLGDARRPLVVLVLAVASLLLITCANLAGLLLARASVRARELALRTAMGATRGRLVRQLLTESLLLAAVGVVPGLLVAKAALALLQEMVPPAVVLSVHPALDPRAVGIAVLLATSTGVLFGIAPAWLGTGSALETVLRAGGRGTVASGRQRVRSLLVVAELAGTLVLLVTAGLFGQTLYRLRYANLGLEPDRLLTLRTSLPAYRYADAARRAGFYEDVLARVRALPGVVTAGYTTSVPLEWKGGTNWFQPEGYVDPRRSCDANHRQISVDYLRTMGVPLRRGRPLGRTDGARSQPVALVNETMARQYWPGLDPVGRRFKIGEPSHPWITIVGVVGDVRQMGLDAPVKAEMYLPYSQVADQPWFAPRDLVVRTAGEPLQLVSAVEAAIHGVDPEQPVSNVRTFRTILDEEVTQRRLGAVLVGCFAGLALLLATLGVYGLLSYFVSGHTPEIGVRMAVGASRADVFRLVLRKGMALAGAGVVAGLLGALALARLVSGLLYGIAPADPTTLLAAAGLVTAVALIACYLPARRAVAVDPTTALRSE